MTKWARIEDDIVKEITEIDPSGRFHPSLVWVECPDDTTTGMKYENNTFVEHTVDTYEGWTLDKYLADIRKKRNYLLLKSDRYMLSDYPKGDVTKQQILDYRQGLRDIPNDITQVGQEVFWPVDPFKL